MKKRHYFNMIEIILALGVIMIGVVSLMGLFPVAAKVTSDTMMATASSGTIEQVNAYLRKAVHDITTDATKTTAQKDTAWNAFIAQFPDWGTQAAAINKAGMLGVTSSENWDDTVWAAANWTPDTLLGSRGFFKHKTQAGVWMMVNVKGDGAIDLTNPDLDIQSRALIVIWRSPVVRTVTGTTAKTYTYNEAVRINIKLAWPAERPEAKLDTDDGATWTDTRTIDVMSVDLYKSYL